jgi:glucoamylase
MTYTVAADPSGMACAVTASDASHGYRLVTTYITDPARDTVLMRTPAGEPARLAHLAQQAAPVRAAGRARQRGRRRR